jgi:hypothetical protein
MKFTYDPETGQYRDSKGRVITDAALRRMQEESEDNHVIELMAIGVSFLLRQMANTLIEEAEKLTPEEIFEMVPDEKRAAVTKRVKQLGPVTSREYQARMQEQISLSHTVNTVLASGGFDAMTIQAWNFAEKRVGQETAYAVRFASQTQSGQVSPAQFIDRTSKYAGSTYTTFSGAVTKREESRGMGLARRFLEADADHCEDCFDAAGEGWVPIDEVLPIGESQCGARCRCHIDYKPLADSASDEQNEPRAA